MLGLNVACRQALHELDHSLEPPPQVKRPKGLAYSIEVQLANIFSVGPEQKIASKLSDRAVVFG